MSNDRNPVIDVANEQRREHTGLRILDEHYSAEQVYRALDCPLPFYRGVVR